MRARRIAAAALLGWWSVACGHTAPVGQEVASSTTSPVTMVPGTQPVPPDSRIGAVFLGGGDLHTCTASVLDSTRGDLILTAAHCLSGGIDATFVAGFDDDADAADTWHIDTIYLDPRWIAEQDPLADFAIARVSGGAGDSVAARAGGGLRIGEAPAHGTTVTVTGYGVGEGGGPIQCRSATASTAGFPSLSCRGLVAGVSGSPWTTGTHNSTVTGLVGGLDGGGCDDDVSYSPPFDGAITQLLTRAEAGGPGDEAPTVFDDGC